MDLRETIKTNDQEFCGKLPVSFINLIQSYGYLLVLNKKDYRIIQASENFFTAFNTTADKLLETPLNALLNSPSKDLFPGEELAEGSRVHKEFVLAYEGVSKRVQAVIHFSSDFYLFF